MGVIYRTLLKSARLQAVIDDIGSSGKLIIGTSGMAVVLGVLDLSSVAGVVSGNTLTFNPIASNTASASGTAVEAVITNGSTNIVSGLTVGGSGSGANLILSSVTIDNGDTITINSGSIIHG